MSRDDAPVFAVSLTWRDAPSALRMRAALPLEPAHIEGLRAQGVDGLVEVHTCARSMWIAASAQPDWAGALLQSCVAGRLGGEVLPRVYTGSEALRHALRVAVGLDSYVQGESDIGGQFLGAFDEARAAGQAAVTLNLLHQAAARILAEGRERGFVRPNRGLGQLAVAALVERKADLKRPVAVIGAGAIGARVLAALRRAGAAEPTIYNRTLRDDCQPLDAVGAGGHAAAIVCTAGPAEWFVPPAGLEHVIDLGMPAQVAEGPGVLGLDALLAGDPMRLATDRLRAAEDAVERELGGLLARVRAVSWQRGLAGMNTLRDQFLDTELASHLADSLGALPEEQQRRVLSAARGAFRQYNHRMLTWIKEEMSTPEES